MLRASPLESLLTVAVSVFFTTERLDATRVKDLDQPFEENQFDVLIGDELDKRGQRYRFVVVDVTVNRTSIVACMGHLSEWTPEVTPSSRESVATEL